MNNNIKDDIQEIILTEEEINEKVKELGAKINEDYSGKAPVLVSILKGSVVFLAGLLKNINIACSIDFIAVSSYGRSTESSGVVKLIMDLRESIEGMHVLLVEDIVDTGLTMEYLRNNLLTRNPESFKICTLLSKLKSKDIELDIDYKGFEIPDKFVVGYGLDYAERYRNLPFVATLKPEIYSQ